MTAHAITATESEALRAHVVGARGPDVRYALDCDRCQRPVFVRDYYGFRAGEFEACACGALNWVHADEGVGPVARAENYDELIASWDDDTIADLGHTAGVDGAAVVERARRRIAARAGGK